MKRLPYPIHSPDVTVSELRSPPPSGWINAARRALGLTLNGVGRLIGGKSAQSIKDAENRELDGTISLARLREIGEAMNMDLVYGFVPRGGSVDELLLNRARKKACELLTRSRHHMVLEGQTNHVYELEEEIEVMAQGLLTEDPHVLWT
ncbi:MAG: hypothetical protein WBA17_05975 [Saprospiraceae bacterium]